MKKKTSILSLLLRYKYSFLLGIIALSLVDLAQLSIPIVIQWLIDTLTLETATFRDVSRYGLYILGLGLIMAIFRLGWRYFIMGAARKIEQSLRNDFFKHLQSLHFDFFSSKKVGDLMAHTVNDVETLKFACGLGVLIAYDGIFLFFLIFGAMMLLSPELTLYAFIPFPFLAFVMYKFGTMIEHRFQKSQDSFSELTESARQSISGIKVIKAFVREPVEVKDFEKASLDYFDRNINLIKVWGVYQPLITFFAALATAVFLLVGGISAVNMEISVGKFTAMLVYLALLTWPMMAMAWSVDIMKRGNASINRLNNIFRIEPKKDILASEFKTDLKGDIKFNKLNFSYDGEKVLENINLEIPFGNSLGITGTTGSGKTTLINLLMKIYEVEDNSIFIDGIDINKIPKTKIQEAIVYVPQETTVFSGTIRDNITFMNPNLVEEDVIEAIKTSEIYNEIMEFPDGLDSIVGERGLSLSGGQRQRVAIARALLLNPRVLILDDSLSSLDLQTESRVLKNLAEFMEGRTLITVSSRVQSIKDYQTITVFEDGKIIEEGNYKKLIDMGGIYSGLHKIQAV